MLSGASDHVVIIGAGAAGLIAARELARAGRRVTVLEARNRCGGRIYPLPAAEFGYPAEAGAEFVHGKAPVTRALMREAGLSLAPVEGAHWSNRQGKLTQDESPMLHAGELRRKLAALEADLSIAEFLQKHFADPKYEPVRRAIKRMVEGYDAADPARASTFALRAEWMQSGLETQGRIAGGYGALIDFLATDCRRLGVSIRLGAVARAVESAGGQTISRCADGHAEEATAAVLAVPLPLLDQIALPAHARARAAASARIGFGNVVKILLRFATKWWAGIGGKNLSDLSFLFTSATIPTWWTQHPAEHPVLTGWFAGPKTLSVASLAEDELIAMGVASLAETFGLPIDRLKKGLVAAKAVNWENDPFARGAYSYATPETRAAQSVLAKVGDDRIFFSGEALYRGRDVGTVEAAFTSGLETAHTLLALPRAAGPR